MITFEEYQQTNYFNENDYDSAKKEYINSISKDVRAIDKLIHDNANLFNFGCCWVTDYGDINGNETDDDALINIFTYNGMMMDSLGYEIDMDFGFETLVGDLENTPLHEQLIRIFGRDFYDYGDYPQHTHGWYRLDGGDLKDYYRKLKKAIDLIKKTMEENKPKEYMWVASSNDGSFEDKSDRYFTSKGECYNDMRNAVLEKMKWNTNYHEDFEGHRVDGVFVPYEDEDNEIGYNVHFHPNHIVHESFSGVYTYKIVEKSVKSAPRFTIDGLFECADEECIKALEGAFRMMLNDTLEKFTSANADKVKSLKISGVEHICM